MPRRPHLRILDIGNFTQPQPTRQFRLFLPQFTFQLVEFQIQFCVFGGIARTNRVGPLEHHVLEQVGDAGDARPFIHRSNSRHPTGRDISRSFSRKQQNPHPIVERLFLHRQLLGNGNGRQNWEGYQSDNAQ